MTDLSTTNLKRLLDQAAPGPWKARGNYTDQIHDAAGDYLGIMHDRNTRLAAAAPQLADELLRMREALHYLSEVWEAVSIDPDRLPAEQDLAAAVVAHIDEILGDHDV